MPALVTLPGAGGPITQIAAGAFDSLAVTSTGQLYAFGENVFGELGSTANNKTAEPNTTPALVALGAGTTVDAVARGPEASHTLVLASSAVIAPTIAPTKATTQRPTLSSVSLTNKSFRVARQATAISAKRRPLGTSFRFTLSAAAKLEIAITRSAPGLRHGRSCLAPSAKLKRAHAKHCTRTITVATLTRANEPKGADSVPFSGRIGRRALSPRGYRALLSASNAAGSSKPVALSFTIVH